MSQPITSGKADPQSIGRVGSGAIATQDSVAAGAGGVAVKGNVEGDIIIGDNNIQVNAEHGAVVNITQDAPQVRLRHAVPQPPRASNGFVNRTSELAHLDQWIAAHGAVTVHGPDGEGKSALLRQAANGDAAHAMPNGVVIVEGIDERGQVLGLDDVIQRLFDALFESNPPLKVNATTARTDLSNTRPLVLLDGFHLPSTALNMLADLFPQGALLITATHAPTGDVTQPLELGPLPREESIRLLAARANATVDDANRPTLDAICAALEDMPLAIVMAARAIREHHIPFERASAIVTAAVAQPGDAIPDGIERVWALLYATLSDDERQVLAAAAVSPGATIDPEWVRDMMRSVEWADAALERLQGMGLLHANSPRLRIDPGLRAIARMGADEDSVKEGLITYLIRILEHRSLDWDYCAAELGNVLGLIDWAAGRGQWLNVIALGRAIDPYLTLHGLWEAWRAILDRVLQAARAIGDRANEAWALHQLGTHAIGIGQTGPAIDFLRQALDLRHSLGDTIGVAYTQHNLDLLIPPPPPGDGGHEPPVRPNGKLPASGSGALKSLLLKTIVVGVAALSVAIAAAALGSFPPPIASPAPTVTPVPETCEQLHKCTETPSPALAATSSTLIPTFTPIQAYTLTSSPAALPDATSTTTASASPPQVDSTEATTPTPRRQPTATKTSSPTPVPTSAPLSFSWTRGSARQVNETDWAQVVSVNISGGRAPYTVLVDGVRQDGTTFDVSARLCKQRSGVLVVQDADGQVVSQNYALDTPICPPPPPAPNPGYPGPDTSVGGARVTFSWEPVPEPNVTYTVEVQDRLSGSQVAFISDISATSVTIDIHPGSFQWRVQAVRTTDGQAGPWSGWISFSVFNDSPLPTPAASSSSLSGSEREGEGWGGDG